MLMGDVHAPMDHAGMTHSLGSGSGYPGGASEFLSVALSSIQRYADPDVARAAGYHIGAGNTKGFIHAPNPALKNNQNVDPSQPEVLTYQRTPDGRLVLTGAMFRPATTGTPPLIGEPAYWHSHTGAGGQYMLHVWLDMPDLASSYSDRPPDWVKALGGAPGA